MITDSIKLISLRENSFGGTHITLFGTKNIVQCRYRITLISGHTVMLSVLEGIKLIEDFFKNGKISPVEASVFLGDIRRVTDIASVPLHWMAKLNDFMATCKNHVDLMTVNNDAVEYKRSLPLPRHHQ